MKFRFTILLVSLEMVGCASLPYRVSEPSFGVSKDIFRSTPIWSSPLFEDIYPTTSTTLKTTSASQKVSISSVSSPGLYTLLSQVDPANTMLAEDDDKLRNQNPQAKTSTTIADANSKPLPDSIVKEPLTRAYVIALAAAYYNPRVKAWKKNPTALAQDEKPPEEYKIENLNDQFSARNFLDFGKAFLQSNLALVQQPVDATATGRIGRIAGQASTPITYENLALQYFIAYYGGNFVDRDGGQLAKPTLGMTISDTTLSNAATVGLAAIFDYAVLAGAAGGDADAIKAPIVYNGQGANLKWQTAKNAEPTLAKLAQNISVTTLDSNTVVLTFIFKPTSGTFTLTAEGKTTGSVVANPTAAAIQDAVRALKTDPDHTSQATVSGGAGGPYTIKFAPAGLTGGVVATGTGLNVRYIVEPLQQEGASGISPSKLQLIRFVQGIAGDGASGLSGVVMRTFGGVHIGITAGLGALGKISVGDDNTLANLVETALGDIAAYPSELFTANALYGITYVNGPPNEKDPALVKLLKFLSNFNIGTTPASGQLAVANPS
jgi:hypothetical protein